jgi:Fe-S oxidoreductase
MALPLKEIRNMLADSINRTNYPVPISGKVKDQWAHLLDIPEGGETVLYTGALYQLMPYTKALMARLEGMEKKKGVGFLLKVASGFSKMVDVSGIASMVVKKDADLYDSVIVSVAKLLTRSGIGFGCLYDRDVYSGALLYDLGLIDDFAKHVRKIYPPIKEAGVRRIITIDPHTHHLFHTVLPEFIDGYDLQVVSYLELLAERLPDPPKRLNGDAVIHDPCFYARFQGMVAPPRHLLEKSGVQCKEPYWSGEKTFCCGGPMESIAPHLSNCVAEERMTQLRDVSKRIITLCPVCHIMLSRVAPADVQVLDLAMLLNDAWSNE